MILKDLYMLMMNALLIFLIDRTNQAQSFNSRVVIESLQFKSTLRLKSSRRNVKELLNAKFRSPKTSSVINGPLSLKHV